MFNQRGTVGAVYRLIPEQIKGFRVRPAGPRWRTSAGLVLITGPTRRQVDDAGRHAEQISERREHILTIEDQLYIHQHKGCLVNQRDYCDSRGLPTPCAPPSKDSTSC